MTDRQVMKRTTTMNHRFTTAILRVSLAAILAGVLGACSTTQRTSSGMGTMDDATASKPADTATPATASQPTPPAQAESDANGRGLNNAPVSGTGLDSEAAAAETKARADKDALAKSVDAAKSKRPATETLPDAAKPSAAPAVAAAKADDAPAVFPTDSNAPTSEASKIEASNQPVKRPTERSVYFEYDKSIIKDQYDAILRAQAAFLESHKNFSAEIQGNCDERGSREYNLALGARRAEAVKQALVLLGVDGEKITTVSFGSEKPVALGKDEESYTQNRRVDIVD
jgi:peptidoglycan-associated lipoprotein